MKNVYLGLKEKLFNSKMNKKLIRNYFTISIYVFIIFSSMLPNKNNTSSLHELNTIIPGINKVYSDNDKHLDEKKYSFKLFEILQNIL